jgi:mono/diheme cytochrome c family protein
MKPFAAIVAGLVLTGVPQTAFAQCRNVCRARTVVATAAVEAVVVTPAIIATFVPIIVAVPQYSVTVIPTLPVPVAPVPTAPAPYTGPQQPSAPASPGPTAGPAPAGQSPEVAALQAELARVRQQLEDCQKQLAAPKPVPAPAPVPAPVAPIPGPAQAQPPATPIPTGTPATKASAAPAPHLALFAAKCAACHDAKVSVEKGGQFTLLTDGRLAQLDGKALARIAGKVYTGRMPPKDNKAGIAPLTDEEVSVVMAWIDSVSSAK